MPRLAFALLLLASSTATAHPAAAVAPDSAAAPVSESPPLRTRDALLPAAAAVIPGLVLHGSGSFAAGDRDGAAMLLATEGAGLGLILGAGIPIALTGASRLVIAPLYLGVLTGVGLVGISGFGNLYGGLSPSFSPGAAAERLPDLELGLGYQHVVDGHFPYGPFATADATARFGRLRLTGALAVAATADNQRLRLEGAWRFFGPAPAAAENDGSFVEAEVGAYLHRFGEQRLQTGALDVLARGRYALGNLGPSLRGAFGQLAWGYSLQGVRFPASGVELHDQLLAELGFGVFLGGKGPFRGEALAFYDHRKDDFPGGLRGGAGVPGFVGLRTQLAFTERWGLRAEVAAGTAFVARAEAVYQLGGSR